LCLYYYFLKKIIIIGVYSPSGSSSRLYKGEYVYDSVLRFTGVSSFRGTTVGEVACRKDGVNGLGVNHNRECKYVMGDWSRGEGLQ
jgi:hypothetical protein